MPVDEMRRTVDGLIESSGRVDLINITGGEPTLHPDLLAILRECRRPEIGRVTMNSNGILLAEDPDLCRQLAELGVYVILSFNTFDPEVSRRMHGRDLVATKLRAIENLQRAGVRMTLLTVLARGLNEGDLAGIFRLLCEQDNVLSLTVQTMAYTGQGGGQFPRARHIPVDEAARLVCEHSGGVLELDDFVTRPSAHPLCYLIGYLLKSRDRLLPFARFAPRERIRQLLEDSYLLRARRATISLPTPSTSCTLTARPNTWPCCAAWSRPSFLRAKRCPNSNGSGSPKTACGPSTCTPIWMKTRSIARGRCSARTWYRPSRAG